MVVHNVKVDDVGAGIEYCADIFTEAGKVS
jgi:hypothetical protein